MDAAIYIYALLCPTSGDVRYVGKTTNIPRRYARHLQGVGEGDTPKVAWVRKLKRNGLQPLIVLLEESNIGGWEEAERRWISYYRTQGARLLNVSPGGDGWQSGMKHSPETISKMKSRKQPKSLETRQKIQKTLLGRVLPSEQRKNVRVGHQGLKRANSSSQYVGVSWHKATKKWRASLKAPDRIHCLGYYRSGVDAALAYNRAAVDLFGPEARVNNMAGPTHV